MSGTQDSATALAKTTQPAMGAAVLREALFARLDQPPGRTAIWIHGAPGSGKTTLAASYLASRGLVHLWYQVDADDADPAAFFHHLRVAARRLEGLRTADLPSFTLQHGDDVAAFARRHFRALFAKSRQPFALVLDNLHAVPPTSVLHEAVQAAMHEAARGCCVVVTSRFEPPAWLARLRAAGQVAVVGGADLAMGPEEVAAVAKLRGQSVSAEEAARLYERTRGWAAGLVLLLEHAKFTGRVAEVPGDAPPQVVFDYLAGETFDRFEPSTQAFLLRVACLPRMTEAVAEQLSGERSAARMLINLAANDYFVRATSVDGRRMYEMHPLLRDFLRNRAAQALPEATGAAWLRRAAALLRESGQVEDAATLLIESHDWAQVADLARERAESLLAQGRGESLVTWLDALPEGTVEADPRLARVAGAARAHASPRAARRLYEHAFEGFRAAHDSAGMAQCCSGVLRAIVMEFDDLSLLDRWLRTFEDLAQGESVPGGAMNLALAMPWARGLLVRDPAHASLHAWLERMGAQRAVRTLPAAGGGRDEPRLMLAMAELLRGDIVACGTRLESLRSSTARRCVADVLPLAIASGLRDLLAGRHADAERAASEGLDAAGAEGIHVFDAWLRAIVVAARLQCGDATGAREALRPFDAAGARLRRGDRALAHYFRGWLAALERDALAAYHEAKAALAVAAEVGMPWLEALARLATAQMQTATGDHRGAQAQIRAADAIAVHLASPWLAAGARLAEAGAARVAGDGEAVREALRRAFGLCREHAFLPPPQWHPDAIAALCVDALEADIETGPVRRFVREARVFPSVPPLRAARWPWQFRVRTLGGFQLLRDEMPIAFSGKGPGRPIELLKVLVALGGREVRAETLADALWPQAEADFAHQSFTATLHRLRRTLQSDEALLLSDGRLSLGPALVWVDTWALEQALDACDAALRAATPGQEVNLLRRALDEAGELYRGAFLPEEAGHPAFIAQREQLRARILRLLARAARCFEQAGDPDAATDAYLRFVEVDEVHEGFYRPLLQGLQRRGEVAEAKAVYERLRAVLATHAKSMPSAEVQAIYASLGTGR